jgi:hypothetical protein
VLRETGEVRRERWKAGGSDGNHARDDVNVSKCTGWEKTITPSIISPCEDFASVVGRATEDFIALRPLFERFGQRDDREVRHRLPLSISVGQLMRDLHPVPSASTTAS